MEFSYDLFYFDSLDFIDLREWRLLKVRAVGFESWAADSIGITLLDGNYIDEFLDAGGVSLQLPKLLMPNCPT